MTWKKLNINELVAWQQRLHASNASLFQFPSWLLAFENIGFFKPQFYGYETEEGFAYCGLLSVQFGIVKAGIISAGPVVVGKMPDALASLPNFLKAEGFTFVRISGEAAELLKKQKYRQIQDRDSFPFYKDVLNHFIVHRADDKETLKAGFKQSARNKINKVERYKGYRFVIDDEGKYLDQVYELFVQKGNKNKFTYRPKESYKLLFVHNSELRFARFYLCFFEDTLVNAILIVRDKQYCMNMSGALDEEVIQENVSPAVYLHYYAMQHEFYAEGVQQYDLLYSDGAVGTFKKNFNPEQVVDNRVITIVFEPLKYQLYDRFLLKYATAIKRLGRKAISMFKG